MPIKYIKLEWVNAMLFDYEKKGTDNCVLQLDGTHQVLDFFYKRTEIS